MNVPRQVLATAAGAVAGYLWYRAVGCKSGTCPLTSNPVISVFWGALCGFLLIAP